MGLAAERWNYGEGELLNVCRWFGMLEMECTVRRMDTKLLDKTRGRVVSVPRGSFLGVLKAVCWLTELWCLCGEVVEEF